MSKGDAVLARKSLLILLSRFSSQALSFIALIFITQKLGTDIYGSLVFSMAFVATFNCLSDLGFNSANVKRISEGLDVDECISTFTVIKLCLTGLMVTLTIASVLAYTYIFHRGMSDTSFTLLLMFIGYYVLYDLAGIAIYTFDARMETVKSNLIQLMDPVIRVPVTIYIAVNHMSVNDLALAYLLGAMAVFIMACVLLLRSNLRWKKPSQFKNYWAFAHPLMIASIFGIAWTNVDKVVIGFFGSTVDLAFYNSGVSLMSVLSTVGAGVGVITFPLFSKYYAERNLEMIRINTIASERYISMLILPVVVAVIIFPYATLSVACGPEFRPAGAALQIIVISTAIGLFNSGYFAQLSATNRSDMILKLTIFTLVLNTVLLVLFVPSSIMGVKLLGLSYMGAAYAGLITAVGMFMMIRYLTWNITRTPSNPRILIHIVAACLTGISLYLFGEFILEPTRFYDLIIVGFLSIGLFFGFLTLLKEFTRKDLDFILETANLKKMWKYIKSEIHSK